MKITSNHTQNRLAFVSEHWAPKTINSHRQPVQLALLVARLQIMSRRKMKMVGTICLSVAIYVLAVIAGGGVANAQVTVTDQILPTGTVISQEFRF
jgi:hypothetical protein